MAGSSFRLDRASIKISTSSAASRTPSCLRFARAASLSRWWASKGGHAKLSSNVAIINALIRHVLTHCAFLLHFRAMSLKRKRRILAIDDEPAMTEWLKILLEHAGFEVKTALIGTRGEELCKTWRPDAVVTDMILPDVDG